MRHINQDYPEFFARFYDLIYHQGRDSVDTEFFVNEICQTKGKILEIGVGTGRLFARALQRGADIYGLDVSQSMLDILLQKIDREHWDRVRLQNIIDFAYDFKFDLIVAPFRVMMHLLDKDDQLQAINNVYKHLNPGGKFIFDAFVPDLNQLANGLDHVTDFQGEYAPGEKIKRIVTTQPDLINQLIQIEFRIEWDEDGEEKFDTWVTPLRFFFRYELEHLIERSNFHSYQILGDYEGNGLDAHSREFILVCQK